MRSMVARPKRYLYGKELEFNVSKTRIMRFRKGRGKKRINWIWKKKTIEEVKEFTYLRYVVQSSGRQKVHVKERMKTGAAVMKRVWRIEKR